MEHAGKNIKMLRERHGLSQAEMAEKLGVTKSLITQVETGKRTLTPKTAKLVAEEFGIDPEDLWNEKMEIPVRSDPYKSQYTDCHLVEAKALASVPSVFIPDTNNIIGTFRIPGLAPREKPYLAIQVEGPSMEPTIRQGDVIVIDRMESRAEFNDDKIYVIIIEGMALVKRVKVIMGDEVTARLISENGGTFQDVPFRKIEQMYKTLYVIKDFM